MNQDTTSELRLKVVEIFQSIQGEGRMSGTPMVFIRLAGCNLSCNFCDTYWRGGTDMTLEEILKKVLEVNGGVPPVWILWTGGEPTLQLTSEHTRYFHTQLGAYQAIESNGTRIIPGFINYITISPKQADLRPGMLRISVGRDKVNEIRIPFQLGDTLPDLENLLSADHYFISPVFDVPPTPLSSRLIYACLQVLKKDKTGRWQLSVQLHKLLNIP